MNSAFFALPRTVGSVREALTLLGVRTVRRWATVMAISPIPDVPDELVALGLRRAHMCEILAGTALPEERETLFTIGLFSVADALLRRADGRGPRSLPFTEEIQAALLRHEGPKGELLAAVAAYERGEFPTLPRPAPPRRAPTAPPWRGRTRRRRQRRHSIAGAYRAALEWADEAGRVVALSGAPRSQRPRVADRRHLAAPAARSARAQASSVAPVVWTSSTSSARGGGAPRTRDDEPAGRAPLARGPRRPGAARGRAARRQCAERQRRARAAERGRRAPPPGRTRARRRRAAAAGTGHERGDRPRSAARQVRGDLRRHQRRRPAARRGTSAPPTSSRATPS